MPPSPQEYSAELAQLLDDLASTLARDARRLESASRKLLRDRPAASRIAARSTIQGLQDCLGPLMHCALDIRKQHATIERLLASPPTTGTARRS